MAIRILTSLIGLVVFFAVLLAGAIPFNIAVVLISLIMLYEFYKSLDLKGIPVVSGYISGVILLLSPFAGEDGVYFGVILTLAVFMLTMLYEHGRINYTKILALGFGTLYISLFMGTLVCIREAYGVFGVLLVFICAWLTDTGAYFTGRFFGKHKLAPKVSPKKTIEGAIGGVVCACISAVIYLAIAKAIDMEYVSKMEYFPIAILAFITSIFSQLGDLVASAIKRDCEVKDFGSILPGHGGLLDRFDSVLFISPFVWILLMLLF